MEKWQIIQEVMTADDLRVMIIKEADNKLRTLLCDVDPFWVKWSFWLEELDKKSMSRYSVSRSVKQT